MKSSALALVLVLSPMACHTADTPPTAPPTAATKADTAYDFSRFREPQPAEEFVRVCQQESGFNFTYSQATQQALATTRVQIEGTGRVMPTEFESFLRAELGRAGFTCKRTGPEHLRVLLVETRAG
jgi:hypothetical protein